MSTMGQEMAVKLAHGRGRIEFAADQGLMDLFELLWGDAVEGRQLGNQAFWVW